MPVGEVDRDESTGERVKNVQPLTKGNVNLTAVWYPFI
jgi:hypothetical protein